MSEHCLKKANPLTYSGPILSASRAFRDQGFSKKLNRALSQLQNAHYHARQVHSFTRIERNQLLP